MIDSHCHFDFNNFDPDRESVWQRCQTLGLEWLIIPGFSPNQWQNARAICQQFAHLSYAAGVHPYQIQYYTDFTESELRKNIDQELANKHCVGVGECGLDKRMTVSMDTQIQMLNWHLNIAADHQRPIILHCVHADNELIRTLKHSPCKQGVIHGFSGSYEMAMQYIEMGFYLGIGGTITYPRAKKTRDAVSRVPLNRLVLESDAPDMPVNGRQGQRNSPEYLPEIAESLAQLRATGVETLVRTTSSNTRTLFNLADELTPSHE